MSLAATLDAACAKGKLSRSPIGELDKSCCTESTLEVFDLDTYAHSLGGVTPATTDGARCDAVKGMDLLSLLEMKGLRDTELNFHHQVCPKTKRGATPAETTRLCLERYQEFLDAKIQSLRLADKLKGSLIVLEGLYPALSQDFSQEKLSGRYLLIVNFSYREIINHRYAFRTALKPLAAAHWGEPDVLPCDIVNNEESFHQFLGA
ncbi:hypothetical protein [Paucidesulfovibrio longus]|uniref:hypothetical protein n=1 Tax=Paucidesulfovibrio longus TaxID=889 RepID=UPI0003B4960B|nr:hypothetical protein [Paucidesulfovibrio longus]